MGKYISYKAAVEALRSLFEDSAITVRTVDEIFEVTGRSLNSSEQNRKWLTNRLTDLKHYDLVKPLYTEGTPKILAQVQLTQEGRHALETSSSNELGRNVSLESIARDIKEFEKQNPSICIDFSVSVKRDQG